MAVVDEVASGTLGTLNTGLSALNISLPGLTAQLEAAIALGLGPLKFDLAAQLNAALTIQASVAFNIGNPLAAIQAALLAVAQLQAALQIALTLPPIQISVSAELSAAASLAATLSARLGLIEGIISAALAVKIPITQLSLDLGGALSAGPAILLSFDGISDGTSMSGIGSLIAAKFASPVTFSGDTINPGDPVSGMIIITKADAVFAALPILFSAL